MNWAYLLNLSTINIINVHPAKDGNFSMKSILMSRGGNLYLWIVFMSCQIMNL